MAEPGLSELVTTTLRNRQKQLRNNMSNNNPVLKSMEEYGGIVMEDGGRTIIEEMSYAQNDSFIRYEGGQVLNTSYNTTMTSAEFDWKQFAVGVVINGREERQNSGEERSINLLEGRIRIAEDTLDNHYNSDMLSNGTADGGKQIGGLALIVSKTPTTGTVGGIDRSTTAGAFYRNFAFNTITDTTGGAPGGAATSSANVQRYYNYMINQTLRGNDRTKLILAGQTHYEALQSSMQAIQRIMTPDMAKAGYQSLEYQGIPVVMGGGVNFDSSNEPSVQTDLSYFLNTKYLKMRVHKDANMEPLPELQSINQDSQIQFIIWMGNMTCSGSKFQGVMFDS